MSGPPRLTSASTAANVATVPRVGSMLAPSQTMLAVSATLNRFPDSYAVSYDRPVHHRVH